MAFENCEGCRFGVQETAKALVSCRRFPPKPSRVVGVVSWPALHAMDWCGEFQARPPAAFSVPDGPDDLAREAAATAAHGTVMDWHGFARSFDLGAADSSWLKMAHDQHRTVEIRARPHDATRLLLSVVGGDQHRLVTIGPKGVFGVIPPLVAKPAEGAGLAASMKGSVFWAARLLARPVPDYDANSDDRQRAVRVLAGHYRLPDPATQWVACRVCHDGCSVAFEPDDRGGWGISTRSYSGVGRFWAVDRVDIPAQPGGSPLVLVVDDGVGVEFGPAGAGVAAPEDLAEASNGGGCPEDRAADAASSVVQPAELWRNCWGKHLGVASVPSDAVAWILWHLWEGYSVETGGVSEDVATWVVRAARAGEPDISFRLRLRDLRPTTEGQSNVDG